MLDRPEESKDFQDIESLVAAKVVTRIDLESAVTAFEQNIMSSADILSRFRLCKGAAWCPHCLVMTAEVHSRLQLNGRGRGVLSDDGGRMGKVNSG